MDQVKILSLNCRGLGDKTKRKDVFKYLRQKNFAIYCLQDTHFVKEDYNYIRSQWGYDIHLSCGTSDSRGVAVLFNNNIEYKILKERADGDGNFLILEIEIAKKFTFTLVNLYGPNQDKPEFYINLAKETENCHNDFQIFCGDWNLVQDKDIDYYNYVNVNNPKARNEVIKLKEIYKLQDPWRVTYPSQKRFTWFKRNPVKKARLDFFLISEELMSLVNKVDINPGYRTDHSIIELELRINDFDKGKGFWKFNNQLLLNTEYISKVKSVIASIKAQYAATPYNRDKISEIEDKDIHFTISDQMLLDLILLEVRGMSIPFAANIKRQKKKKKTI